MTDLKRGVMLDMARLIEKPETYFRLLPHVSGWGYNLLHLHFTDDQGCALRYRSHPELATPHAFSIAAMKEFVQAARSHGLEVIPELECFGHTGFITRCKRYRHLAEVTLRHNRFSGICAFHPETRSLLSDLIHETIDIFQPRILHAGLDEVNFGAHPYSKRLLKKKNTAECFSEHVQWCHETIRAAGARMAMWGDHLLSDTTETIAKATPRDTLIFDWHYEPDPDPATLDFFIQRGFEVYGAPAVQCWHNRILSNRWTFDNLLRFADYARARPGVTGLVATAWCPTRYVPGTLDYPLAFAGAMFQNGQVPDADFAADFATSFWGVKGKDARQLGDAVTCVYRWAPLYQEYERLLFGKECSRPERVFTGGDRALARERLPRIAEAEHTLRVMRNVVTREKDRLRDLCAAARFIKALYAFGANDRTGSPGWSAVRRDLQAAWLRSRYDGASLRDKRFRFGEQRAFADSSIMWHVNQI